MIAGRGSYYVVCGGFRIFLENHRSRIYSFDTATNLEFKLKAAQTKPNVVHASNFMFQNQVFTEYSSVFHLCANYRTANNNRRNTLYFESLCGIG